MLRRRTRRPADGQWHDSRRHREFLVAGSCHRHSL